MLGRDLIPAKVVLAIKETKGGARFEAAKLEIGKAIIKPKTVATKLFLLFQPFQSMLLNKIVQYRAHKLDMFLVPRQTNLSQRLSKKKSVNFQTSISQCPISLEINECK